MLAFYLTNRCGWKLKGRDVNPIRAANTDELVVDGIATVVLNVNGTSTDVDVFVTRDVSGLILGIDWMTRQGPSTFDFLNNRVRFGTGKWLPLLKDGKSQMVRRCYVDHGTVLRPTGQIETDMRISPKGINEPSVDGVAKHVELLDNGSAIAGDVRLDSAEADYDLTEPAAEILAKITASLPSELSEVQQANTKALLVHHRKILSTGDHAIVGCCIDMDDVRQTRQAFEPAKFSKEGGTDEMLEHGVITLAASPWASNVVHVAHPPFKFYVDCRRLNGISSQEKHDDHENSAKVAALSNGTESQIIVKYGCEDVATLLYKRLPSVADMGVGALL